MAEKFQARIEAVIPASIEQVWEGKAFRDEGTITAYEKPSLFVYTYWTSFWGVKRTADTTQTIRNEFKPVPGGTRVIVTQSNIATVETRDHSQKNWTEILDRLARPLN